MVHVWTIFIFPYRNVNIPVLPQGLKIMADPGFQYMNPLIVLPRPAHFPLADDLRLAFKSRRSMIERCFGIIKKSYAASGTHHFRHRRWHGPLICNVSAAMYNRCRIIFTHVCENLNLPSNCVN